MAEKIIRLPYNPVSLDTLRNCGAIEEELGTQEVVVRRVPDAEEARIMGTSAFTSPVYSTGPEKIKARVTVRLPEKEPYSFIGLKRGKVYPVCWHWVDKARGDGYWAVYPEYE